MTETSNARTYRYGRTEQGARGILWSVYEGPEPDDYRRGTIVASFLRREDALRFMQAFDPPKPATERERDWAEERAEPSKASHPAAGGGEYCCDGCTRPFAGEAFCHKCLLKAKRDGAIAALETVQARSAEVTPRRAVLVAVRTQRFVSEEIARLKAGGEV